MRCVCCNKALNDYEATRRSAVTNEFLDLCNECFKAVGDEIKTIDRPDLRGEDELA
jgi:hypothetical protein